MRNTRTSLVSILGMAAVLAVLLASCDGKENYTPNPNNPPVQDLPQEAFVITVCEEEPGVEADSTYRFFAEVRSGAPDGKVSFNKVCGVDPKTRENGKVFDATPDIMELVLTPWNSITFESTAMVNAASETDVIDIRKNNDLKHYILSAKKTGEAIDTGWGADGRSRRVQGVVEGESVISFWNGDKSNEVMIRVRTANHIDVEGFEFALDGKRYLLVEQPPKTVAKDVANECYLCGLPCIAKPSEEYYILGKTDYQTEDIYPPEKFSTLEFLGTVPRNATPDNRIAQHTDALSFKCCRTLNDYEISYIWDRNNDKEFRWMPFYERSKSDNYDNPNSLMNYYKVPMYPADLRARKGKIYNINIREAKSTYYSYTQNYYFRYTVRDGERAWWGVIINKFFGQQ